ncbi:serine hydrolase domain-containing protein [Erwinia sp.]|uniref:serine hydrolase domain-containing protein n=1 Tax=Erwinia citreus TaxID=558 RepID=UPI0028A0BBE2|nr:serine hydrolase domain-containing protein [Erwinia sp.]
MHQAENELVTLLHQKALKTFPGMTMALGKGDKIIWQAAAGYADAKNHVKSVPETQFGIGSITKVFVAVIVLQLVEEGLLSLDDPLSNWLKKNRLAGIANAESVSVRQLLSHYSGIPSWENQPLWISAARGQQARPNKIWLPDESLDYIRGTNALCLPGEAFNYSNSNFTLSGLLIEAVTAHSFEEALRRRIIHPLLLKSTFLAAGGALDSGNMSRRFHQRDAHFIRNAGIADAFTPAPNNMLDVSAINLSAEWAAGGIVSTARDVMTFMLALKNGKLLQVESMTEMQRWLPADGAEMGLSLFRTDTDDGVVIGHGGNVLGASACVGWYEETDCAIAILTNVGSMHAAPEADCASLFFKQSAVGKLAQAIASRH